MAENSGNLENKEQQPQKEKPTIMGRIMGRARNVPNAVWQRLTVRYERWPDVDAITDRQIANGIDGIIGHMGLDSFTRDRLAPKFGEREGEEKKLLDEKLRDRLGEFIRANALIQRQDEKGNYYYQKLNEEQFKKIKKGKIKLPPTTKAD